ncbi:MAG: ABC transporter permease [Acidobacteriota bacterium]|nr:ABC transporter permease [Acidobacteriota bacterium]MDH3784502.1 ABC transporter permease [Acidobacteriota bacterium]
MIRHLLKLVWNRKRTHLLIVAEMFLSFIVVFALLVTGLHFFRLYRIPMGFDHENVWRISVDRESAREEWGVEEAQMFRRLHRELESMPEILSAASADNSPFSGSQSTTVWEQGGSDIRTEEATASSQYLETLKLELIEGRWFEPGDHTLNWQPVVIDQRLAEQLVGDGDALGFVLDPGNGVIERRVIGVITGFRRGGPFAAPMAFMFRPALEESDTAPHMSRFVIRLVEGTGAEFEERMIDRLQSIAHGWTFTTRTLENQRKAKIQERMVPLAIVGTIGTFLLIMVVLGLTGVMWQNVVRRTREIGLRRATGAHRSSIHRQIVLEVVITALFGVLLGVALAAQLPIIGPFTMVPVAVVIQAIVVSTLFLLTVAGLCGLYPGLSATRILPAEALHYE